MQHVSIWKTVGKRAITLLPLVFATVCNAHPVTILHSFAAGPSDGAFPNYGGVAIDASGNLYGSTTGGGPRYQYGTVFELAPDGTISLLYSFQCLSDGCQPEGGVTLDSSGDIIGTATSGGVSTGDCSDGCGVIFKITANNQYSILHAFMSYGDGQFPYGTPILDQSGNIYGTTSSTAGTVFEIGSEGYSVRYEFGGAGDGYAPHAGVVEDAAGNLYGTTSSGGDDTCRGLLTGCGVVFKLTPDGKESILHTFEHEADGACPEGGLAIDPAGNIFGTTYLGGTTYCGGNGCGALFKIAPDGTFTTLRAFLGPSHKSDGAFPTAGVVVDKKGNIFGTTSEGGTGCPYTGCGTVFEFNAAGHYEILHHFGGMPDGELPLAPLIEKNGKLYGTTQLGGANGFGTVFRMTP
jgi:uncharacterized repeat protein (TIGR03803 family)